MRKHFDDNDETLDEDGESEAASEMPHHPRASRAWRSIERYREMKELRKHLDDFLYEDYLNTNFKDLSL